MTARRNRSGISATGVRDAPLDEKLTDESLIDRIDLSHQAWLIRSQLLQRREGLFERCQSNPPTVSPLSRLPPLGL